MNTNELRALQKPFKDRYRAEPASARQTLTAEGTVDVARLTCRVQQRTPADAGLHPATGGSGEHGCSAEMLLEALVSCAGVTLAAVSTAMGIPFRKATVRAEGDIDFRGTLGVEREAPVGLTDVRLIFQLDTEASEQQLQKLVELTERYCVVFQTLKQPPQMTTTFTR